MATLTNFLFIIILVLFPEWAHGSCSQLLKNLTLHAQEPIQLNLKGAQEVAEEFVSRKIASEVLTDPGVEAALSDSVSVKMNEKEVSEAIEEALLARGMSPGQAKKASVGWTKAMKHKGILGNSPEVEATPLQIIAHPVNLKRAQELAEDFVNRQVASEVLTDPGVEAALQEKGSLKQKVTDVSDALEEALLARGMSPGQAKKAAQGWSQAMKNGGIFE